jgi:hypothetical protein
VRFFRYFVLQGSREVVRKRVCVKPFIDRSRCSQKEASWFEACELKSQLLTIQRFWNTILFHPRSKHTFETYLDATHVMESITGSPVQALHLSNWTEFHRVLLLLLEHSSQTAEGEKAARSLSSSRIYAQQFS